MMPQVKENLDHRTKPLNTNHPLAEKKEKKKGEREHHQTKCRCRSD